MDKLSSELCAEISEEVLIQCTREMADMEIKLVYSIWIGSNVNLILDDRIESTVFCSSNWSTLCNNTLYGQKFVDT